MRKLIVSAFLTFSIFFTACPTNPEGGKTGEGDKPKMTEEEIVAKAKEIHKEVITLDTHCDINTDNFTDDNNYSKKLENTQVDIPSLKEGGLDVPWFIVYTGQGELNEEGYKKAYENAIDKFDAIDRLVNNYSKDDIDLALTSEDVRRIHKEGKLVAMIGVENAYPMGTDLSNVKKFADRGARYMSLSHNRHSQFSDSNTEESKDNPDAPIHNGLSELGKKALAEMNKWGIMVDISHPSQSAIKQMIELSKAPVIASHSSARGLADHPRNLTDEQLEMVKKNGGVVQAVALGAYLNVEKASKRRFAEFNIVKKIAEKEDFTVYPSSAAMRQQIRDKEKQDEYFAKLREIRKKAEPEIKEKLKDVPKIDVKDFVDHIDYMVKKIGVDHVGISSDFDGGGGVEGWNDASETLNVTIELVRRGYTKEEIEKIWSGNLLRVLDKVQEVAKQIQEEEKA